jgi:hypothetical protein
MDKYSLNMGKTGQHAQNGAYSAGNFLAGGQLSFLDNQPNGWYHDFIR